MNELKLCKNCKHYSGSPLDAIFPLKDCSAIMDPVTGKAGLYADIERDYRVGVVACGQEGKLFEEKITLFGRLK